MKEITIHGLGYVGLTAAVHWAKAGFRVIGYDPDPVTIRALCAGTPRAGEFLAYLNADVQQLITDAKIVPVSRLELALGSFAHIVAVPTERDGEPYDDIAVSVAHTLLELAKDDAIIIMESTLTPGFSEKYVLPHLVNQTYAVCPRRDWFADPEKNLATLPRIVGGVTPKGTEQVIELLKNVSEDCIPTDYRTAELTKALENAMLHVPIMLAAELAMNMPGHNIAEALALSCSHWRLMCLYLGMGTGGRCVPLGTKYLLRASGPGGLLEAALTADRHLRVACARAVAERGVKTALVLGIGYRPDFKDAGTSPGLAIAQYLRRDYGVEVTVADPLWADQELANLTGFGVHTGDLNLTAYDAVLLATPHTLFRTLPEQATWREGQLVLDGQGTWADYLDFFNEQGVHYRQVGMAGWLP